MMVLQMRAGYRAQPAAILALGQIAQRRRAERPLIRVKEAGRPRP
jgi:hypothetical protein